MRWAGLPWVILVLEWVLARVDGLVWCVGLVCVCVWVGCGCACGRSLDMCAGMDVGACVCVCARA